MPKKKVDVESAKVLFSFEDKSEQTFELAKVPQGTQMRLALHGASQKIGDSYAGAAEEPNPVEFAKAQVAGVIAQLYAGDWTVSGGGGARVNTLVVAFAEFSGKTIEESTELLEAMSDDEKKALAKKPKLVAIIARIRAERAIANAEKAAKAAEAAEAEAA